MEGLGGRALTRRPKILWRVAVGAAVPAAGSAGHELVGELRRRSLLEWNEVNGFVLALGIEAVAADKAGLRDANCLSGDIEDVGAVMGRVKS